MKAMIFVILCLSLPALAADPGWVGSFAKKSESVKGSFTISEHDGKRILSISEDFKTSSGPDLQIVLCPLPFEATNGKNALSGKAISLGALTRTKGAQTYVIPAEVDLTGMRSLLIHCVKYAKLWGGANLEVKGEKP